MVSSLQVSIPTTSVNNDGKPYTVYVLRLQQPLRSYTLTKRYSDFTSLHSNIISQCDNAAPPAPLPQKSWFKSTMSDPTLTENRRRGLEEYMTAINEARDARWRSCGAWKAFLNLPASGGNSINGGTAATSLRNSSMQIAVSDPSIWLDLHSDMKSQLRNARLSLTKRDQASTAHTQHEASAEVKRCLVKASTMLSALDQGLQEMGASQVSVEKVGRKNDTGGDYTPRLGDGEIRRRRDIVSAAKNELAGLETLLTSVSARNASNLSGASASAENSNRLLNGGERATPANGTGRRVIGAPLKETERTRELDNTGVLQLQQQILQEQDEDVTDLTKVVTRMKEMGVQINNELELQNQMLGMLDQDVARVGDKVNIAKKRIAKIK